MRGFARARLGATWLVLALLGGCAVHTAPRRLDFGIDKAELLGDTIAAFRLADGSEVRLRALDGAYSLKLQSRLKVVPIPNATAVRLESTHTVGDRTLVVLEKAERNCASKFQVFAIQGSEVLGWDFGNCTDRPVVAVSADAATFDYVASRRVVRFTYRDGRLVRSEFPNTPEAYRNANAQQAPARAPLAPSQSRYMPGLPIAVGMETPAATASAVRREPARAMPPSPAARANSSAPPPKPLTFPTQEQKPVRIVLDE